MFNNLALLLLFMSLTQWKKEYKDLEENEKRALAIINNLAEREGLLIRIDARTKTVDFYQVIKP